MVLILVAVLMAAGDTAGQLAANERLFRLATGPGVLAFQSHFVVHNVGAYAGGVAALVDGHAARRLPGLRHPVRRGRPGALHGGARHRGHGPGPSTRGSRSNCRVAVATPVCR